MRLARAPAGATRRHCDDIANLLYIGCAPLAWMGCVDDRRIPPRRSRVRARARSPAHTPHRTGNGSSASSPSSRCSWARSLVYRIGRRGRSDRPGGGAVRDRAVLHGRSLLRPGLPELRGGQLAGVDLRACSGLRSWPRRRRCSGGVRRPWRAWPFSCYCCSPAMFMGTALARPRLDRAALGEPHRLPSPCSRTARATAPRRARVRRPGRASAGRATSLRRRRCRA